MTNGDGTPRPTTPVSSQAIDPVLIQQMLVALTNLQLQVANRPSVPSPRDPKVPDVQTFNGNKGQYSLFLARLLNFFTLQPLSYDSDSKKIGYVISRLDGTAADWAVTILENQDSQDNWQILNDWNGFLKAFSKFSDPFSRRNATDSLLSLTQGSKQSVLSYWTKFSELLYRSDISPDSARPLFERGLKYEIRDRLVDKDLPSDLDGYVLAVIDLDNRLFRLRQDRRSDSGLPQRYVARSTQGSSSSPSSGVAPMEIGALGTPMDSGDSKVRLDEIRNMPPDQRWKVCFDEHRCHYCKRVVGNPPAHVAQNCPWKGNKAKSDYFQVLSESQPQKGIPDISTDEGIPQRQDICLNFVNDRESMLATLENTLLVKAGKLVVEGYSVHVEIMLDSGAMGMGYVDRMFVENTGLKLNKLARSIPVKSIDGSACGSGAIDFSVLGKLSFDNFCDDMELMVIDSPRHPVILGYKWFCKYNPSIVWTTGKVTVVAKDEIYQEGIPICTSKGIPPRQVSVVSHRNTSSLKFRQESLSKRVTFAEKVAIRVVENYIESIALGDSSIHLPSSTSDFESPQVEGEMFIGFVQVEDEMLIGFVDQYSVVQKDSVRVEDHLDIYDTFKDVFSSSEFPALPAHRNGTDLAIELNEGKNPPFGPIYSLSKKEEEVLKKYLEDALEAGIIQKSKSPAGAPVMFVKKADGSLRLCVDYRGLNSVTKTNRAALPIIRDMLFRVEGAELYSKIDLKNAFNLIRIQKGHEYLTAFRTKYGHFEYMVMPFGLKNAPGQFQTFMNSIFGDLIDRGVLVYIDDLLLYSFTRESHDELLKEVFNRLRNNGLKANPKKCSFYQSQVQFLGHLISLEGVEMDSAKLDSIQNWKEPTNVKELQSFLGLCNYYRDFIPNYAELAGPLYKLTKKESHYKWSPESQESFDAMKSAFSTGGVLSQPDTSKQFYLECDASDYALGAVLSQKDNKGTLRPIGFYSRKFTSSEVNYEIYDKELLAIIEGLKNWRHYCIGTDIPVIVFTDHRNLQYFMSSRHLNRRQARWSLFLADYNFEISVRSGAQQIVSDALSRQESLQIRPEDDEYRVNEQILFPPDKFSCKGRSSDFSLTGLTDSFVVNALNDSDEEDTISSNSDFDLVNYESSTQDDDFDEDDVSAIGDVAQFMEFEGDTESEDPPWFQCLLAYLWSGYLPMVLPLSILRKVKLISKSFIFKNDRLFRVITRNSQIYHVPYVPYVDRQALVAKYHVTLGHMQVNTLLPLMEVRYYWPSLSEDIRRFQISCNQCQMNGSTSLSRRPLQPHEPVGLPFLKWGIDYVQDLPEVDGFCNIFSARCYATKRVIYCATKDRTARTAARCIFELIVCKYGAPVEIVSDRGFMDSVLAEYLKILDIHHLPSAAYSPQTNGLDERGHQDLKRIITKLSDGDPKKWTAILPLAEFIMNSRISNSTGFSAFYLSHGFEPRLPCDAIPALPPGYYDLTDSGDIAFLSSNELARLGQNRAAALQRLKAQSIRMKTYYDKKVGATETRWENGDVVKMLNHSQTRFKHRFIGPFYIAHRGPNNTYFLQRPDGRRWTSQNGTDTPVNPDDLAPFTEFDAEYYYAGT